MVQNKVLLVNVSCAPEKNLASVVYCSTNADEVKLVSIVWLS